MNPVDQEYLLKMLMGGVQDVIDAETSGLGNVFLTNQNTRSSVVSASRLKEFSMNTVMPVHPY